MFPCKRSCVGGVVGAAVLALLTTGCGTTLLSDDSSSGLLELLASLGVSEETTVGELLDQVTVGDVVSGLALLANYAGVSDATSGSGGFQGGPQGPGGHHPPGPQIELTEEQQAAADAIFESARTDMDALRATAEDAIRALLTEDRLVLYDELPPLTGAGGGPGMHGHRGPGGPPLDRLADELSLTDEQLTAIDELLTQLRDDLHARHAQAQDEFLALLTEEQLAELDWTTTAETAQ